MMATRQVAFGKAAGGGVSAKSYIQDGLVAMWDGIENAGWGKHDEGATVWTDLVGGITIKGSVLSSNKFNCTVAKTINLTQVISQFTIEVIRNPDDQIAGGVLLNKGSGNRYTVDGVSTSYVNCRIRYWNGNSAIAVYPCAKKDWGAISYTYDKANAVVYIRPSGRRVSYGAIADDIDVIQIFAGTTTILSAYNIRLYNRALTDEEIAHNYEIDKVRFGL